VIEDDDRGGQVEDCIRQAERVVLGHRYALPAGRRLICQVADARREAEGRVADGRCAMRQDAPQRFERVGGRELLDGGATEHDGTLTAHLQRPTMDADERVSAVARTLFDGLEEEGTARPQPQGRGHGRERVGCQLEAVDRCERRNCGGHRFGIHRGTTTPPSSRDGGVFRGATLIRTVAGPLSHARARSPMRWPR
jgi:hypothetical protein